MIFRSSAIVWAGLALSLTGAPALAACKLGKLLDLPVTMSGRQPLVPAKINGVDLMFIADSGAFFSMINPTTAQDLKLSREPLPDNFHLSGIGGEGQAELAMVNTFTLAGLPIPRVPFIVATGAGGAAGLLGQNVWRIADVEYDLANGAIRLFKPTDCGTAALAYWAGDKTYSVLDIHYPDENNPHTEGDVYINGVKIRAIFDTGANTSIMTLAAAARAGIKPDSPGVQAAGLSSGIGTHVVRDWIAPIASFKLGGEEIKNTKLMISDSVLGGGFDPPEMLLGADFFLSHRVYVANSQHKLYFTYNGGAVFDVTSRTMTQAGPTDGLRPSTVDVDAGDTPKDADGFARRGAAFLSRRDLAHALADFDKAVELAPDESKYVYQRAQTRLLNRQPLLAMTDLDQVLKLKPDHLDALILRSQLRLTEKDIAGAQTDLAAADKAALKDADLRLGMAGAYVRADLLDLAVGQYDLWIAAHAEDGRMAEALNGRCWARAMLGKNLDKALGDCNRALNLGAKTAAFLDSRGLAHLRRGENDQAMADYNAALTLSPKQAWSLYGRAIAELRQGKAEAGRADLAAAVAIMRTITVSGKKYGIVPPDGFVVAATSAAPTAATPAAAPAICALKIASSPAATAGGVVTGFEDRAAALAAIPVTEARAGGKIDPDYIDNPRVVVRGDDGKSSIALAPKTMTIQIGDRVAVQGPYRNPALACNYVPPLVTGDQGSATTASAQR